MAFKFVITAEENPDLHYSDRTMLQHNSNELARRHDVFHHTIWPTAWNAPWSYFLYWLLWKLMLNTQLSIRWFQTPWCTCDLIAMFTGHFTVAEDKETTREVSGVKKVGMIAGGTGSSLNSLHHSDVIMGAMTSQITSINRLFRRRSKKTSKLRVTSLCAGNSPVTGEFPAQWPATRKMFSFDDVIKAPGCFQ